MAPPSARSVSRSGFAQFVDEAGAPRVQGKGGAAAPVETGPGDGIAAAVVQTVQFFLEIIGGDGGADVQFERCGVDACRHGPVPTLEFAGHHPVEMHHPNDDGHRHHA